MSHTQWLWHLSDSQDFGPLSVLSRGISELEQKNRESLPDLLRSQSIFIASDYSGEHDTAEFQVLSFLFGDWQSVLAWNEARVTVRNEYLRNREMSYKRLKDKARAQALSPFLNAANNLSGLSVTIATHKKVASLFSAKRLKLAELGLEKYSHWDISTLEKLFRVVNFIGFFVTGLACADQDIRWITDEDAIVANEKHIEEVNELCDFALNLYAGQHTGSFSCEIAGSDDGSMFKKDLVAIPDLIAGALSEILSQLHSGKLMPIDEKIVPLPDSLSSKSVEIVNWFADYSKPLKRILCVIPPRSSPWSIKLMDFQPLK
jgi:hypothetical protein